jgi:glyoxylase-like metal-dependent hydrolase (beta-lactamase superfamily II)
MSKAKRVCDRVYAVGGPGISSGDDCCVYLVDAGSELVLIDAGLGFSMDKIIKNIRSVGFEPAQIWHAVATHCHIDHVGGLSNLVEGYGTKVIAHQLDRAGIEGQNDELTAASMYGVNLRPVKVDTVLNGDLEQIALGDVNFNFIHTPGHTPGSISVYFDSADGRVLFAQDVHGPFSPSWGSDLALWRQSMQKLLALKADILCEGHAGVYRGDKVNKYIEAYIMRYQGPK